MFGEEKVFARSPYPLDGRLTVGIDYDNWQERYRAMEPVTVLQIDRTLEQCMPVEIWDYKRSKRLYDVSYPDFDRAGKFNSELFWSYMRKPGDIVETIWKPTHASMRVQRATSGAVAGLAQMTQLSWCVKLYFPRPDGSAGLVLDLQAGRATSQTSISEEVTKKKAVAAPKYNSQKYTISDIRVFSSSYPFFLWESSEGYLVWTKPGVTDRVQPAEEKPVSRYILLDSYDRLVAMEYYELSPSSEVAAARKAEGKNPQPISRNHNQLRLYGDFSERLVDEIITSYVAFKGQVWREIDYGIFERQEGE
ncbi:hypothetical protein GQ53DRAFT_756963 [Thozetella sp. PMI_491]|nr:hypothetical protein GQ53DRAFT_756963 [Thozetella sp. PMI_491]